MLGEEGILVDCVARHAVAIIADNERRLRFGEGNDAITTRSTTPSRKRRRRLRINDEDSFAPSQSSSTLSPVAIMVDVVARCAIAIIVKVVARRAVAIVANVVVRRVDIVVVSVVSRRYLSCQLRKNLPTRTFSWVMIIFLFFTVLGGKTCCSFDCTPNVDTAIEEIKG